MRKCRVSYHYLHGAITVREHGCYYEYLPQTLYTFCAEEDLRNCHLNPCVPTSNLQIHELIANVQDHKVQCIFHSITSCAYMYM